MFPAFAGLLPGLISAGGNFLKRTGADILAGKNVLKSAKENAITAANEILPGAGDVLEKGITAVGKFIGGRKKIAAGKAQAQSDLPASEVKKARKILQRVVENNDVRSADIYAFKTIEDKAHKLRKKSLGKDRPEGIREVYEIADKLIEVPKWFDKWGKKFPARARA